MDPQMRTIWASMAMRIGSVALDSAARHRLADSIEGSSGLGRRGFDFGLFSAVSENSHGAASRSSD